MNDTLDPNDALAAMQAAQHSAARRAVAPAWYHGALGLLTGGMVAMIAAPPLAQAAYFAVFFAGLLLLVSAYRKKTGVWVSGFRAGRTAWVTVGALLLTALAVIAAMYVSHDAPLPGPFIAAGVFVAIIITAAGYAWEAAYRKDLGVER